MKNKRGVTFSVVIVAIVIMLILVSSASVIGTRSISTANFEEYKSEIGRVHNDVNAYYIKNKTLPVKNEIIDISSLDTEFKSILNQNGDNTSSLYVVDVALLEDATIKNGKGTVVTKDVYLVSSQNQNIYYHLSYFYQYHHLQDKHYLFLYH